MYFKEWNCGCIDECVRMSEFVFIDWEKLEGVEILGGGFDLVR